MSNATKIELPQSVVFDMDGTLLDTETPARQAFSTAIVTIGYYYDADTYDRCIGTSQVGTQEILEEVYGAQFNTAQLYERWTKAFHLLTQNNPIQTKPGIRQVLEALHAHGVPMAVATSNQRKACEGALSTAGVAKYFQHYVCAGETQNSKPAPDPYLAAIAHLNADPMLSWGIEDSDIGTLAAVRAGLKVFQIPDQLPPSVATLALGHKILSSAEELLAFI